MFNICINVPKTIDKSNKALNNIDFKLTAPNYVYFDEKITSSLIEVVVIDDNIPETDESFVVVLQKAEIVGDFSEFKNSPKPSIGI